MRNRIYALVLVVSAVFLLGAASNRMPLLRAFLQSNMDGNGFAITNVTVDLLTSTNLPGTNIQSGTISSNKMDATAYVAFMEKGSSQTNWSLSDITNANYLTNWATIDTNYVPEYAGFATNASNATNFWGVLDPTNLPTALNYISNYNGLGTNTTFYSNVTVLENALGTTITPRVWLTNGTSAALGAQQVSPALMLGGQGWRSGTSATMPVQMGLYTLPTQGTIANPLGTLVVVRSISSAAPSSSAISFRSDGQIDGTVAILSSRASVGTALILYPLEVGSSDNTCFRGTTTMSPSTTSGAGFVGALTQTPSAADQRLGYLNFGADSDKLTVGIGAYSDEAWSGSTRASYLRFDTTPTGSLTRSETMRLTGKGNLLISSNVVFGPLISANWPALKVESSTNNPTLSIRTGADGNYASLVASNFTAQGNIGVTATNFVLHMPQWVDMIGSVLPGSGVAEPVPTAITNGSVIKAPGFQLTDEEHYAIQLPHNIAITNSSFVLGTNVNEWHVEPHIHYMLTGATVDATHSNVTWQIEWAVTEINGDIKAQGTNSVTQGVSVNGRHYLAEFGPITNAGPYGISSMFNARLTRQSSASQELAPNGSTRDVVRIKFDLHVPVGNIVNLGSRGETSQ